MISRNVFLPSLVIAVSVAAIMGCSRKNAIASQPSPPNQVSAIKQPSAPKQGSTTIAGAPKVSSIPNTVSQLTDSTAKLLAYSALSGHPDALKQLEHHAGTGDKSAIYGLGVYYSTKAELNRGAAMPACGDTSELDVSPTERRKMENLPGVSNQQRITNQLCYKAVSEFIKAGSMRDGAANYTLSMMQLMSLAYMSMMSGSSEPSSVSDHLCDSFTRYLELAASEHDPDAESMLSSFYQKGASGTCSISSNGVTHAEIAALDEDACWRGDGSQCVMHALVSYKHHDQEAVDRDIKYAEQHKNNMNGVCTISYFYNDVESGVSQAKMQYWSRRCSVLRKQRYARYPVTKTLDELGKKAMQSSRN